MAYPSYPRFSGESLAATNPIGFADSIASLGNLIEALDQRRQAKARQDEMLALQQRDREIAQARESRQEAQGMRKSKADWTKHNVGQKSLADARAARGGSAEPLYMYDDEGNLRTFNPEAIQQEPMVPPDASGVDLPPLPPGGPQDIDSALQGAGGAPGAPELPPAAPQPPIETLQGTAPGPETMAMLNALPFGGGKPAPATPAPQAPPAAPPPGPAPQAGSATMRPPIVRGASYKALPELATVENLTEAQLDAGPPGAPSQVPKGQRVVYRGTPLGDITIDQEQARNDLRAQREFEAEGIQQQLADPNLDPAIRQQLERQLAIVKGGIPPKPGQTILAQAGMTSRQQTGISSQEGMQRTGIESREKMQDKTLASKAADRDVRLQIAQLRSKRGASGGPLLSGGAGAQGGAYQRLFAANPLKAERTAQYVDAQIARTMKNVNFDMLMGKGVNRLQLGLKMLDEGGTGEFEAMMNFFGYIRGGVPAKNETDEWYRMTRNPITILDNLGRQLGLGAIGSLATRRDLSPEEESELRNKMTGMTPQQKAEMKRAMASALSELRQYVADTTDVLAKQFGTYRAPAEQELVQGKIDGLRQYAGLSQKSYFNLGGQEKQGAPKAESGILKALGLSPEDTIPE